MEDLNKHQIVLLAILVSFVTSIATGITTVSLLEDSPNSPTVTQTVNRVVEKTIEKVIEPEENGDEKVVEKEVVTVVVNQEDLTVEAVDKNSRTIARIYQKTGDESRVFVTSGVIINSEGQVLANKNLVVSDSGYVAESPQGEFEYEVLRRSDLGPAVILKPVAAEDQTLPTFEAATFADSNSTKLGQTVISISGKDKNHVSNGIVTLINGTQTTAEDGTIQKSTDSIVASVENTTLNIGSILVNLQGNIVGMKLGEFIELREFTASNIIKSYLTEPSA